MVTILNIRTFPYFTKGFPYKSNNVKFPYRFSFVTRISYNGPNELGSRQVTSTGSE